MKGTKHCKRQIAKGELQMVGELLGDGENGIGPSDLRLTICILQWAMLDSCDGFGGM
jgi:hypothetical protein